ncbi:DUF58 domain-containing protein [Pseudomonas aeruginosa]
MRLRNWPRWQRWLNRRIPPASSVELNQRRVFILPTRQGGAFGLALLVMLLAAINYQNSLAYGLTFLLLSLGVVTILHTYRNLAGLRLTALGADPVFAGERAGFRVRLESPRRARQAIAVGWPERPLEYADLAGDAAAEVLLFHPTERRGWLRPGRLRVESRFPLGLLVAWSWVDLRQQALVYPRPQAGEPFLAPGAEDAEDQGRALASAGVDDYQGLCAYQPGDSRRRLHWKAFSRGQGLLVKDFAALGGEDLWLEFERLGGDLESRLGRLCHAVLELSARQQPYGLALPGTRLQPASGEAQREACLRALALFGAAR